MGDVHRTSTYNKARRPRNRTMMSGVAFLYNKFWIDMFVYTFYICSRGSVGVYSCINPIWLRVLKYMAKFRWSIRDRSLY